jgi:hypothetical protein
VWHHNGNWEHLIVLRELRITNFVLGCLGSALGGQSLGFDALGFALGSKAGGFSFPRGGGFGLNSGIVVVVTHSVCLSTQDSSIAVNNGNHKQRSAQPSAFAAWRLGAQKKPPPTIARPASSRAEGW